MISKFRSLGVVGFLIILCSLLHSNKVYAQLSPGYAAADLYVDYIGSSGGALDGDYRYRINLIVYTLCTPSTSVLPAKTETVTVTTTCNSHFCISRDMPMAKPSDTVSQLCALFEASQSSCANASSAYPGYQVTVYSDTVTLPFSSGPTNCGGSSIGVYDFTWTTSHLLMYNEDFPAGSTIALVAELNNGVLNRHNVSTPRYASPALPAYLCAHMHVDYPLGPIDPNGDSLYTVNQPVLSTSTSSTGCVSTSTLRYNSCCSLSDPVDDTITDKYAVAGGTGDATFTSITPGPGTDYYSVGFRTFKYDPYTGLRLGFCGRYVDLSIMQCDTTYPAPTLDSTPQSLTGGTLQGNDTITVCPKTPISFTLSASNTRSSLYKIYLNSNNTVSAPGSSFTTFGGGGDSVAGTFKWTPQGTDEGFHTVVFTASDSSCFNSSPSVPEKHITLLIHVLSSITAGKLNNYCGPTSDSVQLYVVGPPLSTYTWSDITGATPAGMNNPNADSPKVAPPTTPYQYYVNLNTSIYDVSCAIADTITVYTFTPITINGVTASPATICANQSSVLSYKVSPAGFVQYQTWSPFNTLDNDSSKTPKASPVVTTPYVLFIIDKDTCWYHRGVTVNVSGVAPIVDAFASPRDTVCPGGSVQLGVTAHTQMCGAATDTGCVGTITDIDHGKAGIVPSSDNYPNYIPTPYNYASEYTSGGRMQIMYHADDLKNAGISPGNLTSIGFYVASKATGSTDSFYNYTIHVACTNDFQLNSSQFTNYTWTTVYDQTIQSKLGWNTYTFSTPYYWDGVSNVVVDICYGWSGDKFILDQVNVVPTIYNATFWNYEDGSCCANFTTKYFGCGTSVPYTYPWTSSNYRPETQWGACSPTSFTYKWTQAPAAPNTLSNTTIQNPVATGITGNKLYKVTVSPTKAPGCAGTDSVYVVVDSSNSIVDTPHNFVLCRPGYVALKAQGKGPRPLLNPTCGTDNPVNCTNMDTAYVFGNPYSNGSNFTPPFWEYQVHTEILITPQDLKASGLKPGTLKQLDLYIDPTTKSPYPQPTYNSISISIGCANKQYFKNGSDFAKGLTPVYSSLGSITLPSSGEISFPFNLTTYNWDTTQSLIISICANESLYYPIFLTYTKTLYASMIANYTTGSSSICDGNSGYSINGGTYSMRPVMTFEECEAPQDSVFVYTWAPGTYLSDSTAVDPLAYIPASTKYYVSTIGRNKCLVRDSVSIVVPVDHFGVGPVDTSVCIGNSVQLHAYGGGSYQWYQNGFKPATSLSCTNCANPVARPTDTTTYQIVIKDSTVACFDTLTDQVNIKPLPQVRVVTPDTTIELGTSIQLYATGAFTYNWWPAATLDNPNIVNPVASPTEPTTYVVTGTGLNGCVNTDSVTVRLGYHGKVNVPTAFSPNGDGKNDVFHITNLTSEKVLEFRVFNRWGQQVFSSTDNIGWDGSWNGVPQDMGVYNYIVRIAYLDGTVQTFKGDVTLIR